mmetsp:Transcript_2438/g.7264  ORF Transcript_2438/g.7264 Transcript_2438/m.7264 type:complete len:608 (-) Transcript_2438:109-1932(-)
MAIPGGPCLAPMDELVPPADRSGVCEGGAAMRGNIGGRCSVRLGSPAPPHLTAPADRGEHCVRIGPLPMTPCLATPLTTPGGRARATRGGTAAAGGAWMGSRAADLRLERLQNLVEQQQVQIDCLCLEATVLRDCLVGAGVLSPEHLLARLHQKRFAAVLRVHPLYSDACFAAALATHELVVDMAISTGPSPIYALRAASRGLRQAVADVIPMLGQLFSRSIYVCGGFDGAEETSTAERFDPAFGAWEPLPPMRKRRSVLAAAVIAGRLYVCGGHDGAHILSSAERFDPAAGEWEQLMSMQEQRWCAAAAVLNEHLYVCGGCNGEQALSSVEHFDPAVGTWELLEPMAVGRRGAMAAVVGGCLYVCGGSCLSEYLSSAERFDPATGSWKSIAPMSVGRGYAAAATVGSRLYMCGGCDGHQGLSSAESYDADRGDAWEALPPMSADRVSPAAAVVDGRIYVCGGRDGDHFLSSAERYNPEVGRWEQLGPMSAGRGAAAAAVLGGQLYVCGGHDDAEFRRSVERFNPAGGSWELLPPMRGRRASASAASLWSCAGAPAPLGEQAPQASLPTGGLPVVGLVATDAGGSALAHAGPGSDLPTPPSMLGTPT